MVSGSKSQDPKSDPVQFTTINISLTYLVENIAPMVLKQLITQQSAYL